jgi:tyrosine-protein kinase Etk/Wzc
VSASLHTANGHSNGHTTAAALTRPQEETFNVREILMRLVRYWYLFVIGITVSLLIAYLYNRYATPRYYTSSTLLIKDRRNANSGNEAFLEGMSLVNVQKNIENEISILHSYSLALATVKTLDFGVSYYQEGSIRASEMYGDLPLRVETDSSHLQLLGTPFRVEIQDGNAFTLKAELKGAYVFNPLTQTAVGVSRDSIRFREGTYRFGEYVEGKNYRFRIVRRDSSLRNGIITFNFHDYAGLAGQYAGALKVAQISKNASVVDMGLEISHPLKGITYLNRLAQVYIETGLNEKNQIAENTIRFITDQLTGISDSLSTSEDRLQGFRTKNQFINLDSQGEALFENLQKYNVTRDEVDDQLRYYRYLLSYIAGKKNFSDVIVPSIKGVNEPVLDNIVQDLTRLYATRNVIAISATGKNPLLLEQDEKIQFALKSLNEYLANAVRGANLMRDELSRRLANSNRAVNRLPKTERDLVGIQRKFTLNSDMYIYLLKKRAEAGIAKAANLPDNKVIDAARYASMIFPKTQYNYTISFVIGLLLPLIAIILMEYLNDTVRNRKDLEKLTRIPVLGIIGHSEKPSRLVVSPTSKSVIAEAFRSLRSNLQYVARGKDKKVILVTSTISGEGKTFCASNLAYVLALSGKRTLLMEIDLRKPLAENDFGVKNDIGLTNYLIGKATREQIIKPTDFEFLHILPAGAVPPNPSEMLMDERMEGLMRELQADYDYILMDSSPVGLVADAFELIKFADLVLFVVRQGFTKRDYVSKLEEVYNSEREKNFNIILNDSKRQDAYGSGRYGYTYVYQGYVEDGDKPRFSLGKIFARQKV